MESEFERGIKEVEEEEVEEEEEADEEEGEVKVEEAVLGSLPSISKGAMTIMPLSTNSSASN